MKINIKKVNGQIVPYSQEDKEAFDKFADNAVYEIDIKNSDIRTVKQNASQWLWLTQIAETLNNNNMYITDTIKSEVEWNKHSVKALIFDPIMRALYNKESSTKLNKEDYNKIIDNIVLIFANKGVVLPEFPNVERD